MADERALTFGVQFGTDTAPLDKMNEKQKQAQEEAEKTAEKLDQVGTNLTDIGARATSAFGNVSGAGTKMGTSVRGAMLNSITAGDSLTKTLKTGIGAAVTNVQQKFQGWGAATKSVARDVGNSFKNPIQTIKATLGGALLDAQKNAQKLGTEAEKTGNKLDDMGKKGSSSGEGLAGALKKVGVAIVGLMVIQKVTSAVKDFFGSAVEAAASAEEMGSKFDTVFKDASGDAEAWAESFGKAANRSKNEIKGFMADSGALFTGMGMAASDAATMSEMMTSLTYDLASFNNLADADAFAKLRSGIMGETEGLKQMGIVLNEATLSQTMLNMGIKGSFNDLDEATKVQVRFNAILSQTADAQGDVTRTAGSYTNSLKGVQGMWNDFLANAGAKFTPVLTGLFNTILEAWPRIEPALMGLVDMLSNGLSTAVPILLELGNQLLPILTDTIGVLFQVASPLIPLFGQLATTVLPPLVHLLGLLATTLLPPIMQILDVVCKDILLPLMPVFTTIAQAVLPPVAQLLGIIAPILQAISPLLVAIGETLGTIAEVVGKIIGWAADGIGKVTNFFSSLFGGSKQAAGGMRELSSATAGVGMVSSGSKPGTTVSIPRHARGTDNFAGGLTMINEEGGEMAVLPSGSKIIPADQTDNIINSSRNSKQVTFAPQIEVTIGGNVSEAEKQQTKAWFMQMCREAWQQMQDEDSNIEALQASLG